MQPAKQLFEAKVAEVILGLEPDVEFRGTKAQVESLRRAISASRALYESLQSDASLDVVKRVLARKRAAATVFRREFGFHWPF